MSMKSETEWEIEKETENCWRKRRERSLIEKVTKPDTKHQETYYEHRHQRY